MSSYQKFIGVGRATKSPELRYTPNGTPLATCSFAFNRRYKQGDELKDEVCFLDVIVWAKRAETFAQYVDKGHQVLLEGYLKQERWESEDGHKHSKHVLNIDEYRLMEKKGAQGEHGEAEG